MKIDKLSEERNKQKSCTIFKNFKS